MTSNPFQPIRQREARPATSSEDGQRPPAAVPTPAQNTAAAPRPLPPQGKSETDALFARRIWETLT